MAGTKVVVYGLSTEGYAIASQMAIKGADVYKRQYLSIFSSIFANYYTSISFS